jgi:prepilin-type N-terminal cleavage/methylation domain-containing protein
MRQICVRQPDRLTTLRRGFTMAEMMAAVSIMVIVTAVVAGLLDEWLPVPWQHPG